MEQLRLFVLVSDLFLHAYQEIQAVAVVVYINRSSDEFCSEETKKSFKLFIIY